MMTIHIVGAATSDPSPMREYNNPDQACEDALLVFGAELEAGGRPNQIVCWDGMYPADKYDIGYNLRYRKEMFTVDIASVQPGDVIIDFAGGVIYADGMRNMPDSGVLYILPHCAWRDGFPHDMIIALLNSGISTTFAFNWDAVSKNCHAASQVPMADRCFIQAQKFILGDMSYLTYSLCGKMMDRLSEERVWSIMTYCYQNSIMTDFVSAFHENPNFKEAALRWTNIPKAQRNALTQRIYSNITCA